MIEPSSTPQSDQPGLRRADTVTGVVLAIFGCAALILAMNFRRDLVSVQQAGWYTAPALVPMMVAAILTAQGILLSFHSLRRGGRWSRHDIAHVRQALRAAPVRRAALVALLLAVFVFGMVGRVHFTLASFLFMLVFMALFRAGAWWKMLLVSGGAAVAISFLFEGLARVPLP